MGEEHGIEKRVVTLAEQHGWFVRKVQFTGVRGAQDRLFLKDGRHVWMEFKKRGAEAQALQSSNMREMAAQGAEVYVVDGIGKACAILEIPFKVDPLRPHL